VSRRARRAALAAFALGALYGVLCPTWQVAVEPAQVLAGLVHYPANNPNFLYQANTWTVLHQLCALLLKAGASELAVSILLGAVVPGVAFAGLALWVTALLPAQAEAGDFLVAVLTPFLALGIQELGVRYPILIAGYEHTYGMAGMAMAVLSIGLLANGAAGAAGLTLALGPAVHPSLGLWTALTALLAWPWGDAELAAPTRRALRGAAIGAAITAASLAFHFLGSYHSFPIPSDERRVYLETFVKLWDEHRPPLVPFDWTVMLATVVGLATGARLFTGATITSERILARFAVAALLVGLTAGFAARPTLGVPGALLTLMPSRFLNVLILGSIPLAVGWLWSAGAAGRLALAVFTGAFWAERVDPESALRLMAAAVGLALALRATSWRAAASVLLAAAALGAAAGAAVLAGFPLEGEAVLWLRAAPLFVLLAAGRAAVAQRSASSAWRPPLRMTWAVSIIGPAALVLVAGRRLETQAVGSPARYLALARPAADDALSAMARGEGMVALGPDSFLIQLCTRRPVLLETGAMDFIPYVPEAGPEVVRILRVLYARDYFHPSDRGLLDAEQISRVWSGRSVDQWRVVAHELGVRDVLVNTGWSLHLPVVARSDEYILYRVPD
jgi:hypothetical protein